MIATPADERVLRLLNALLSRDFPGVIALRDQLDQLATAPGCTCGCGSVDLIPRIGATPSDAVSPAPTEGIVLDHSGSEIGGLLLFLKGGRLSHLEVYSEDEPIPLKDPSFVI